MKALWKNQLLAESDDILILEGDHYFPVESIKREFFQESDTNTICPWRGTAHFLDVNVDGEIIADAAWYYLASSAYMSSIGGRITFNQRINLVE